MDSSKCPQWKVTQFDAEKEGSVMCICGESGKGKSYLAKHLRTERTVILDGDSIRNRINTDLGFSDEDRKKNNLRTARMAHYLAKQGFDVIVSTIRADIAYEYLKDKLKEVRLCCIS